MNDLRTVSPSQMRSFNFCPTQWNYIYNQDISLSIRKKYFDVGNYFHELLHAIYNTLKAIPKISTDALSASITERVRRDLVGENIQVVAQVLPRILEYIAYQHPLIDKGIQVLEVEHEFKIPVTTPVGHKVLLHGIIDLVYRDSAGTIRVRDHKSGERNTHSQNSVKLDDQLLFYAVGASHFLNEPVLDVEISFLNSHNYKTKKPANEMFGLYRYQHTPIGLELAKQNILQQIDIMLESKVVKKYSPQCAGCIFFPICTLELRGQSTKGLIEANYEVGKRAANKNRSGIEIPKITFT